MELAYILRDKGVFGTGEGEGEGVFSGEIVFFENSPLMPGSMSTKGIGEERRLA